MSKNFNLYLGIHDCSDLKLLNVEPFAISPSHSEIENYLDYVDTIPKYESMKSKMTLKSKMINYKRLNTVLHSINKSIFMINGSSGIEIHSNIEKQFTYKKGLFEAIIIQLMDHETPMTKRQFEIFIKIVESISKKYGSFSEKLIDDLFDHDITHQATIIPENHYLYKELVEWYTQNALVSLHCLKLMLKKLCIYDFYNGGVVTYYLIEKRNSLVSELKISDDEIIRCYKKLVKDIMLLDTIQINGYSGLIPEFRFDILYDDGSFYYVKEVHDAICEIDGAISWVCTDGSILSNDPMLEKITNSQIIRDCSFTGSAISYAFVVLKNIYKKGWDQFVKDIMIDRGFKCGQA